ncbi:low-density lipoprotein receptor class A domain-containing protein 1 isoform X2 [Dasypus novemcinctus]|uniref:low-density lipoprotein receptor class A domain-containing protein 1 isoform X2 n=1 Tax=Dasypus novemcinctus TaxID=9361 RepID=UPI0003292CFC|nr:low-density lipoprotein receptor class A domain-containing protein 1 isoform X2 [Dasypus novemcinctus]
MNKIFPQGNVNGSAAPGSKALPGGEAGCSLLCCSRRGACLSAFVLLLLATLAALITLVTFLGLPARMPGPQACRTPTNRTGFLCHDQRSCIPASGVCDGVHTCVHGEDEDEGLCRAVPQSLPSFLVAHCGNPATWIYSDQRCDGTNNCGDCSDELSPGTATVSRGASAGTMCSTAPTGLMSIRALGPEWTTQTRVGG